MEYLSLRSNSTVHSSLSLVWSFGWNSDCNKRGQTSRSVVGTEIQTSCNFKASLCDRYYVLDGEHCRFGNSILESPCGIMVWYNSFISLSSNFDLFLHKDIPHPTSSSKSSTRPRSTTKPNKSTEHSAVQKGSVHCHLYNNLSYSRILIGSRL